MSKTMPLENGNIQNNRIKRVKEIFLEWSSKTDLNCLTKIFIYRHRPLIGLIWLFILVASSGITFWLVLNGILDYFNFSIVSQISIAYETKSLFPTVTICDNNPFSSLQAQLMYEDVAKRFDTGLNDSNIFKYVNLLASNPYYGEEKKKFLGFNLNQIKSCRFANQPCNISRDFDWIWISSYGNCWRFNSGLNKESKLKNTYDGIDFGLDITVSLEIQNKYLFTDTLSQGLIVLIHNNSFSPYYTEKSKAFVEIGKKAFIGIKRTFNYKMPYPYSQCIDLTNYKSDLFNLISQNRTYRQTDCFKLCRQQIYVEKCGCNVFNDYLIVNQSVKFCSNSSDPDCWMNIYTYYNREECVKKWCPLECDSVEYDLRISSLSYSNRNSTARFVVYYPALEYTIIKESPQTTELGLFAQIGGTLGILISISIFTLFEILEVLVLMINALLL